MLVGVDAIELVAILFLADGKEEFLTERLLPYFPETKIQGKISAAVIITVLHAYYTADPNTILGATLIVTPSRISGIF
jgi:hypothetical protein